MCFHKNYMFSTVIMLLMQVIPTVNDLISYSQRAKFCRCILKPPSSQKCVTLFWHELELRKKRYSSSWTHHQTLQLSVYASKYFEYFCLSHHLKALTVHLPSGGWSMSPFLSQVPIGWMSDESTSLQKSLVLSLPSRRRRRRVPIMPITVAMHTELELRGSRASSFMPALKSLEGGILDCTGTHKGTLHHSHILWGHLWLDDSSNLSLVT